MISRRALLCRGMIIVTAGFAILMWKPLSTLLRQVLRYRSLEEQDCWEGPAGNFALPDFKNIYFEDESVPDYAIVVYRIPDRNFELVQMKGIVRDALCQARIEYSRAWQTGALQRRAKKGGYEPFHPRWICFVIETGHSAELDRPDGAIVVPCNELFNKRVSDESLFEKGWHLSSREIGSLEVIDSGAGMWRSILCIIEKHRNVTRHDSEESTK